MSCSCDCWAWDRPTIGHFLARDGPGDAQGAGPAARLCSETLPLGGFLAPTPPDLSRSLAPEPGVFGERTTASIAACCSCCGHLLVCALAGHVRVGIRYCSWLTQLPGRNPSWDKAEVLPNPSAPWFCSQQRLIILQLFMKTSLWATLSSAG